MKYTLIRLTTLFLAPLTALDAAGSLSDSSPPSSDAILKISGETIVFAVDQAVTAKAQSILHLGDGNQRDREGFKKPVVGDQTLVGK